MRMHRGRYGWIALLGWSWALTSHATTSQAQFQVSLTIVSACTVTTDPTRSVTDPKAVNTHCNSLQTVAPRLSVTSPFQVTMASSDASEARAVPPVPQVWVYF